MKTNHVFKRRLAPFWLLGLLAGLAGGLAEIVWVGVYTALTPLTAADVAREVTISAAPMFGQIRAAVPVGVGIHLLLSAMLGLAYVLIVWPLAAKRELAATVVSATAILIAVWAINFFVVLPALNPAFVMLMPLAVTLASKLLFALCMAAVLLQASHVRRQLLLSV